MNFTEPSWNRWGRYVLGIVCVGYPYVSCQSDSELGAEMLMPTPALLPCAKSRL